MTKRTYDNPRIAAIMAEPERTPRDKIYAQRTKSCTGTTQAYSRVVQGAGTNETATSRGSNGVATSMAEHMDTKFKDYYAARLRARQLANIKRGKHK